MTRWKWLSCSILVPFISVIVWYWKRTLLSASNNCLNFRDKWISSDSQGGKKEKKKKKQALPICGFVVFILSKVQAVFCLNHSNQSMLISYFSLKFPWISVQMTLGYLKISYSKPKVFELELLPFSMSLKIHMREGTQIMMGLFFFLPYR